MSEYIHIVSLTAPSPPDYGGAFDLYYKIPALARSGIKIFLHYFDYKEDRGHTGLEPYCVEVHKYKRTSYLKSLLAQMPYIVFSRVQKNLINRLKQDNYPVLLEGIHGAGLLAYLNNRKVLVRVHNDEAKYYRQLQNSESNPLKNAYFFYEAALLSRFQQKLSKEPYYVFVSEADMETFKASYDLPRRLFLPCFIPWQEVKSSTGTGKYCLYHGNLSISENRVAALWLAQSVFSSISMPLIIAGKDAHKLKSKISLWSHVSLVNNPTDEELSALIQNAHINVLPSFNNTGVKLKLIHALFEGRFCFTNRAGVAGSGLDAAVTLAESNFDWIEAINAALQSEFTGAMADERKNYLSLYDNDLNGQKLKELL